MTTVPRKELMENELNLVNGGEGGVLSEELERLLEEIENQNTLPSPVIDPDTICDPYNGPLILFDPEKYGLPSEQ